jgi:peroxiredoxin
MKYSSYIKGIQVYCYAYCLICIFVASSNVFAAPLSIDKSFPDILLSSLSSKSNAEYLGIRTGNNFNLTDIKSEVIIVQIFSMYCPNCQKEAPNVNSLLSLIEENQFLKGKIKIIGIGAGNSQFEVEYFAKNYNVKFPVFSDKDYEIHNKVGKVWTPHFYIIKKTASGGLIVKVSVSGSINNPRLFLENSVRALKLER